LDQHTKILIDKLQIRAENADARLKALEDKVANSIDLMCDVPVILGPLHSDVESVLSQMKALKVFLGKEAEGMQETLNRIEANSNAIGSIHKSLLKSFRP